MALRDGGERRVRGGFHGQYREIVPNERIVCTEVYEGPSGGDAAVCTHTFTESDGHTTLTLLTELPSRAVRDAIIGSGMETGMQAGWDILERIAISLR